MPEVRHPCRSLMILVFLGIGLLPLSSWSAEHPSSNSLLLAPPDSLSFQSVHVLVDPRVEIISIICLLAGYSEYGMQPPSAYVRDIRSHFDAEADHEVVQHASKLRSSRGFCCNQPCVLAVHMGDPFDRAAGDALDLLPPAFEKKWSRRQLHGLATMACDFSLTADFESFFRGHEGTYGAMVMAVKDTLDRTAHLEWLPAFFGVRLPSDLFVVPTLLTGGNHYAAWVESQDGRARRYCILGFQADEDDNPVCPNDVVPLVVHELCHTYVNPMVDRHSARLEAAGERAVPFVGEPYKRSYGARWQTMIYESLVRACVVRYVDTVEGSDAAERLVEADKDLGLPWIGDLSDVLRTYEEQRDLFPTLDEYVSRIAAFFLEYHLGQVPSSTGPTAR